LPKLLQLGEENMHMKLKLILLRVS